VRGCSRKLPRTAHRARFTLDTGGAPAPCLTRMTVDAAPSRAQLIRIETDRRLGHEWDEWDGKPLPGNGDFSAEPDLFFRFAALTLAATVAVAAAVIFLLAPRLADVWAGLPFVLWLALAGAAVISWLWFGLLLFSFYGRARLLPEAWLERGPYLILMSVTSYVARSEEHTSELQSPCNLVCRLLLEKK